MAAKSEHVRDAHDAAISYVIERLRSGQGPEHILVDMHGTLAVPVDEPDWRYRANCVLIRSDGYSISCHKEIYEVARQLHAGQWVAVVCYANTQHRVIVRIAR